MAFITQAVTVLQTLVVALGAGLAVWGVINLMEGYGNDNPGAKGAGSAKPRLGDCVRIKIVVVVLDLSTGKFLFPDTYAKPPQKSKHFSLMCFTNDAFTQFGLPPLNEILSFVY